MFTLREVCAFRNRQLIAAHVRTNHVHCIVGGVTDPSRAIADLKAYATRALNRAKRWSRHGSTVPLVNRAAVQAAIRYVVECQGRPVAVYVSPG
ncbi:MAG TPA: hypothetical protein VMT15_16555 [Bryobacteraceae bacterium]|nr:hypothetical protein [Bryobacteraceae bacterium]